MSENHGAPRPTNSQERWYKIVGPKGTVRMTAFLLDSGYYGCWSHWVGRQMECRMSADCALCQRGEPVRWNGYIAAQVETDKGWEDVILALSDNAAKELDEQVPKWEGMRGLVITLKRDPGKVNGRVHVKVEKKAPVGKIPEPFDVISSLQRMWGVNAIWLGQMRRNAEQQQHRKRGSKHHEHRYDDNDGDAIPA